MLCEPQNVAGLGPHRPRRAYYEEAAVVGRRRHPQRGGATARVSGVGRVGRRDRRRRRGVRGQDRHHRPRVHRSGRGASVAGLRRAEERRARAGDGRLGAVARRRRDRLRRACRRHRRRPRRERTGRRLRGSPAEHLLGPLGAARRALPRLAAAPLPPRKRTVRGARGPRVGERRGPRRAAGRPSRAPFVSRRRRLPGARRPLRHARRRRGPRAGAARRRVRLAAAAARALPRHVRRAPRLSRRLEGVPSGQPLCVLCADSIGEDLGEDEGVMVGKERVLSGMRPSGRLHLGNYLGALANWVKLQESYDCFYFSADWHLLTDRLDTSQVPQHTIAMAADWLGAGLDPERSTLLIQSLVPEHAELHLLFSMVTPVSWLERVPTYRERIEQQEITSPSYGLLGYPLLQAADILMYKPKWVPVGIDQAPHVELTREVARRFNNAFGEVFPEPDVKLTEIPKVPGTDGRKMSKSYGNDIELADPPETIRAKVRPMMTDPARKRRTDPGNPDVCPVFDLHKIFTPEADLQFVANGCRTAGIGCLDCKDVLLKHMVPPLEKIRERRQQFVEKPDRIVEILHEGSRRARAVAGRTMEEVRAAVHLTP